MTLSAELIASITALLIAVGTGLASWRKDERLAKKSEVQELRERVAELTERDEENQERFIAQQDYIALLRAIMIQSGLQVPPLPSILQRLQHHMHNNGPAARPATKKRRRPGIWGAWE